MEDWDLLQEYVRDGSDEAFTEVVRRHLGLVHSTALRRLRDPHMAEEVVQEVFTLLAGKASSLGRKVILAGWLYQTAYFKAAQRQRTDHRRLQQMKKVIVMRQHIHSPSETEAVWVQIEPLLDDAMQQLSESDRTAILLRFFQGKRLREVGLALGVEEEAARKRVERALGKLRDWFASRDASYSTPVLAAALSAHSTQAAYSITAGVVSATAVKAAAGIAGTATFTTLIQTFTLMKFKMALLATSILLLGTFVTINQRNRARETPPESGSNEYSLAVGQSVTESSLHIAPFSGRGAPRRDQTNGLSVAEAAIAKLKAAIATNDPERMNEALMAFWMDFDLAAAHEKAGFREAIPLLVPLWPAASDKLKGTLISTFIRLTPPTEEVVDFYIEALRDERSNGLRVHAVGGLMRSGPAGAKATRPLLELLNRYHDDPGANSPDSSFSPRMALEALGNFGKAAHEAVPLLTDYLEDPVLLYRVFSARAYWKITGDAERALPILTKALISENSFWAAEILGHMGTAAKPATEALRQAYRNGTPDVQMRSYQALNQIEPGHSLEPGPLLGLLSAENRIVRGSAVETLWNEYQNPQLVMPSIVELVTRDGKRMTSHELETMFHILAEIAEVGPHASAALPALRKVLEEPTGVHRTRLIASNTWLKIAPGTAVPGPKKD